LYVFFDINFIYYDNKRALDWKMPVTSSVNRYLGLKDDDTLVRNA